MTSALVTGNSGIGKATFIRDFVKRNGYNGITTWIDCYKIIRESDSQTLQTLEKVLEKCKNTIPIPNHAEIGLNWKRKVGRIVVFESLNALYEKSDNQMGLKEDNICKIVADQLAYFTTPDPEGDNIYTLIIGIIDEADKLPAILMPYFVHNIELKVLQRRN